MNFDDTLLVLNNPSGFSSLLLFTPPVPSSSAASTASALVEVADSTAAMVQPVRPVDVKGPEPVSMQALDEHEGRTLKKTPTLPVGTVALESSAAESSVSTDATIEPDFTSDELWIAPTGEITLGSFFRRRLKE